MSIIIAVEGKTARRCVVCKEDEHLVDGVPSASYGITERDALHEVTTSGASTTCSASTRRREGSSSPSGDVRDIRGAAAGY